MKLTVIGAIGLTMIAGCTPIGARLDATRIANSGSNIIEIGIAIPLKPYHPLAILALLSRRQ